MPNNPPLEDLDVGGAPHLRPALELGVKLVTATRADIERLYRSHFGKFSGYFRRCGQNEAVAHELVQETFIQALRNLKQFDGRAQLATWVRAIARNQLLAHLRKQGLRVPAAGDAFDPVDPDTLTSAQSGRLMEQLECVRRGFAAFAQQHPERAQVLHLAVVEGWSREELAHYLGRTTHAATEYLSQSRAKLKRSRRCASSSGLGLRRHRPAPPRPARPTWRRACPGVAGLAVQPHAPGWRISKRSAALETLDLGQLHAP